jgi:hypothetical protein
MVAGSTGDRISPMEPTVMASDSSPKRSRLVQIGAWLDRRAGSWQVVLLVFVLLTLPRWLLSDQLAYPALAGDDFEYVADARDGPRMLSNLFKPHNTHIVPLFRLWTFALVETSGRLSRLPEALSCGSYFTFAIALLLVGYLVYRATHRPVAGLAAMATLGLSTVMEPVIVWYSAGQALCAGSAIVASLIALECWLSRGGAWRLGLAAVSGIAAPLIWSGGLLAGPAAAVYLWTVGKLRDRRAALAILVLTGCLAGLLARSVNREIEQSTESGRRRHGVVEKATQAVRSTAIAIPEVLVLRNLGIDAELTGPQGMVFCFALGWWWSRTGPGRVSRLEAAGAAIVVGSYLMVYYFRGYMPYEDMRPVGWYHGIPEIGAVLFAAGWWSRCRDDADPEHTARSSVLTRRELLTILTLASALVALHVPRATRLVLTAAPKMSPEETAKFPIPALQRLRALLLSEEHAKLQRRALVRLEGAERVARDLGIGRLTIRRTFGRVLVPGIPELQKQSDAAALLALPDSDQRPENQAVVREALRDYIIVEPEYIAPWLGQPNSPSQSRRDR